MTDEITKSELQAMIEVQEKAATQMERVASSLTIIVDSQKKIIECLAGCSMCKETIKAMNIDVLLIKWILTSLAAVIALGYLILKIVGHV